MTYREISEEQRKIDLEQHGLWRETGGAKGAQLDWSGCNLRDANPSFADLRDANLSFADLSDANLSFADLRDANLSFADLRDANLSAANLSAANLSFADLSFADLSDANLSFADLSDANLSAANLSAANLLIIGPIGSRAAFLYVTFGEDIFCTTGCFRGTLAEFSKAVEHTHPDDVYGKQYAQAIKFIKATAKLRG